MEIMTAKTNGIEMDWFSFGNGDKTFVIIPGLSLRSVMLSARTVAAAYKQFADEYTVYVFDRKKNADAGYSVREMAADTVQVMRSIGIESADIFGASQGGMIAQYIAIDNPDIVHSIVLGSTCSRISKETSELLDRWIGFAEEHDIVGLNHTVFNDIYSEDFLRKYAKALPILEKEGTAEECDRFTIFAAACKGMNSYDELEKIKCPVLVLGAENDKVLSGKASIDIAEKLDCEIFMYEGASHAVYDEASDYKERISKFFKTV